MRLYDEFPIVPYVSRQSRALSVDPFKSVSIDRVIEVLSRHFTPLPREECLQKFEVREKRPREIYVVPLDNPLLENQDVVGYVLRNHSRVVEVSISPVTGSTSTDPNDESVKHYVGVFCTIDLNSGYAQEENLDKIKQYLDGLYNPNRK